MTTPIGKTRAGGALGYYWEEDGDVLDVPDEDARELLTVSGGGFYEIQPDETVAEVSVPATPEVAPAAKPPPEFPSSTGGIKEAIEVASVTNLQKKG